MERLDELTGMIRDLSRYIAYEDSAYLSEHDIANLEGLKHEIGAAIARYHAIADEKAKEREYRAIEADKVEARQRALWREIFGEFA